MVRGRDPEGALAGSGAVHILASGIWRLARSVCIWFSTILRTRRFLGSKVTLRLIFTARRLTSGGLAAPSLTGTLPIGKTCR